MKCILLFWHALFSLFFWKWNEKQIENGERIKYYIFGSLKETFLKFNQHNLDKLEKILTEAGYVVRYERGSFQSGYCILEDKKVVVLNKFLNPEGRINTLLEIIPAIGVNYDLLTHESQKLYESISAQLKL